MVVGAGFMMNMVASSLLQSGAFEVYLNGSLIYSKLETGAVPTAETLADHILRQIISGTAAGTRTA
ncbi:hypothetical protein, conserved [Trypanosoma brucei gambiense DAL972]|uniref:Selenoprotein T n=2 Tax=Trypanosoma brucei TaxID=5691 RepID=Q57W32_TRYB2|nr:hypothetical protein, conserved [Trypanosoma brucei gambiense DAL972]XP_844761.1 hypothetical protein, conserved [Trypanosoma brucei brucei TREU927]AAX70187.1 hypothetical protein, conserved [Trypanosoma brucei]AAZ11202.1 hypothetical protein, conserved [Trypanosoma brucei brucei TREU927]CBH10987.1 hypothetical protein, conserved [Trypanosoma brucei gambiense DAL972]|eukprot:XP_011773274.1 hypothetical protein, conserved [Trypanosoma brucei gambiense DAL972]